MVTNLKFVECTKSCDSVLRAMDEFDARAHLQNQTILYVDVRDCKNRGRIDFAESPLGDKAQTHQAVNPIFVIDAGRGGCLVNLVDMGAT